MIKKMIIILACVLATDKTVACDVCGCALGGNYFGILPMFSNNFIGLRWSQSKFHAYIDHHSDYLPPEYSDDAYTKAELWGRFYLNKRIQLFAFVPYAYNTMNGTEQVVSSRGLADVTVLANYLLVNTSTDTSRLFQQTLTVGGGIKLPTGKFHQQDQGKLINPNFQLGTGSTDFLIATTYTVRFKKIGLSSELGYKINTRNKNDYRFGNQFHASSQLFYWQSIRMFSLLPSIGVYYEQAPRHRDGEIIQFNTGGSAFLLTAGFQVNYKRITFSTDFKAPLSQDFKSEHEVEIASKDRWTLSATYNF